MKTIKLVILFILLLSTFNNILQAQVEAVDDGMGINQISIIDYRNVTINEKSILDIINTKGEKQILDQLFATNFTFTTFDGSSLFLIFEDNTKGLYFKFENVSDSGIKNQLVSYTLFNNLPTFSILGKNIKVGDNITVLGDVKKNELESTISFVSSTSSSIEIKYNKLDNKIIYINYTSY